MIVKRISNLSRYKVALIKFLTFSYAISMLFLLGHSISVWAEAPESEKVAFVSKRDGNAEIYIMNPDGSEQINLTQHPAEDYDPAWSPDGRQILFSSDRTNGIFDLYLMDTDGRNVQKVFKNNKYRKYPTWSPNGRHIIYAETNPGKALLLFGARFAPTTELTLYIATINGDSIEKLTDGFEPSWSPDGSQITFVAGGLRHTPLGIFDLQTRRKKILLEKEEPWIVSPAWSPQGNKIAFSKLDQAGFNAQGFLTFQKGTVYIANRDGTGLQQVTGKLSAYGPTWSPQGNQLIYQASSGSLQLYAIDVNGGNPMQLTHEGNNTSPDWLTLNNLAVSPSVHSLTTTWAEIKAN